MNQLTKLRGSKKFDTLLTQILLTATLYTLLSGCATQGAYAPRFSHVDGHNSIRSQQLVPAAPPAEGSKAALPQAPSYSISETHSIAENVSQGAFLVLDDNTVWSVDAIDRITTSLWTIESEVAINETIYKGYTFHDFINLDNGESVSATYLGTVALWTNIKGEFEGWEGDTVFALLNGQAVKQVDYKIRYYYAFQPSVMSRK